jgi:hypothetical protein
MQCQFNQTIYVGQLARRIVSKYFYVWAKIIVPHARSKRIAYIDLFAGPGRYKDGSASTPIMVLERAIAEPSLRDSLVTMFNDEDPELRRTAAQVRFLSLEPLLGPLQLDDLSSIDWVIAGGESGPGARPMPVEWVRSIRDACVKQGVAFHFKQWGGVNKKTRGRILDGRTWDEMPLSIDAGESAVRTEGPRLCVA